jgi:hypothetical protein
MSVRLCTEPTFVVTTGCTECKQKHAGNLLPSMEAFFLSDIGIATTRLRDVTVIQYEKVVNRNIACHLTTITTIAFIVPSESSDCTTICFVVFQHYFFLVDHIQKFLYVAFSFPDTIYSPNL